MKIGIITDRGKHRGIRIEKICDFGAIELYRADVAGKKKTPSKRALKRLAKTLGKYGITLCVANEDFTGISEYGTAVIDSGNDVFLRRAGKLAILFSEVNGIDADFLIDGGSFNNVFRAALAILEKKRRVYINHPAFSELSEEILYETGAVVACDAPENVIIISMNKSRGFVKYKDLSADFRDFEAEAAELDFSWLSREEKLSLISILEKSGFLEKNRVKIKYFLK